MSAAPQRSLGGAYVRLAAAFVALAAGTAAAVTVALLLRETPGPTPSGTTGVSAAPAAPAASGSSAQATPTTRSRATPNAIATPASPGFPAPRPGAVVFSREAGANALALAVLPESGRLRLQVSVVGPDGAGVRRLTVGVRVEGGGRAASATGTPCGAGCYETVVPSHGRPTRVLVRIGAGERVAFAMPQAWPPPAADRLLARAARVWRDLRTLVSHERLASDPRHAISTVWRFVAPDRLSYSIAGGSAAIIIGDHRWDLQPGRRWQRSPQEPLPRQPAPFWAAVSDAHILGLQRIGGRPAWRVSFFDRRTPAWFTVAIDRATLRTLELRMVTTAHFMHELYGPFNRPLRIHPPPSR
jgi:hypothetical protein